MTGNAPVPPAAWFIFLTIDCHILTYAECVMMDPSRQVKRYEPGRAAKYSFRYAAVAAMSIVNRICMFVFSVGLGIGQGFQPVSAFNYGAKKYGRASISHSQREKCCSARLRSSGCFSRHSLWRYFRKIPRWWRSERGRSGSSLWRCSFSR